MSKLVEVLIEYAFGEWLYDSDNILSVCRGCGEKAWLISDIKHKKKCNVEAAYKAAVILDKESTETVTKQLKTKISKAADVLETQNHYGAKYHIKDIAEVVDQLRQLSAV